VYVPCAKLPQNFKNAIKSQHTALSKFPEPCAKLPQNFKNAIKSQPMNMFFLMETGAKLPQNFKNAIKSQRLCNNKIFNIAQNYHKISKMQSNHNSTE